ncbi:MAG: AIR synthase-related protein [Bacteroidota bacterium]
MSDSYARRGVSADKKEVHQAIKGLDKGLYPTAFCKILPDVAGGDPEQAVLMHADTAGTKTSLAYLYWKETGDLSVWKGIAQDALVMNLDDMMCVGVVDNILVSSTIGRNKHLVSGDVVAALIQGTAELVEEWAEQDIHIHLAGGETADVGDIVRTLDVGYTAFARVPRSQLVINDMKPGDVIVGIASYGQASYEAEYNSGIGSNGLTNARHDTLDKTYAHKYPEAYSPQIPQELAFSGKYLLTDTIAEAPLNIGKLLLSPTRTYLPFAKPLLAQFRDKIHGMIHCTGGGQTKCMKFVSGLHVIKDHLFPTPPIFRLIQAASGASWQEMYQVFNMGHRLEIFTDEKTAEEIIALAGQFDLPAQIIGRCEAAENNRLTIKGEEELVYTSW